MLYAFIADVHGNCVALDAVLAEVEKAKPQEIYCLGDIVGYGADPADCIARLRARGVVSLVGNHDWAVAGHLDTSNFNYDAQASVQWTMDALAPEDIAYLKGLPFRIDKPSFAAAHGSLSDPGAFDYILNLHDALDCFDADPSPLICTAHTHVPLVFMTDSKDIWASTADNLALPEGVRAIVNVGSVGQPRDGDPRGAYVLFDTDERRVTTHRVSYDVEAAAERIAESGLPETNAYRLFLGR